MTTFLIMTKSSSYYINDKSKTCVGLFRKLKTGLVIAIDSSNTLIAGTNRYATVWDDNFLQIIKKD